MDAPTLKHLEDLYFDLVLRHDITYAFTDDGYVYARGHEEHKRLQALEEVIGRPAAVRLWNLAIERLFTPECRGMYLRNPNTTKAA